MNESPFPPSPITEKIVNKYISLSNKYDVEELRESLLDELSKYTKADRDMIGIYPGSSHYLVLLLIYTKISSISLVAPFPTFHVLYGLIDSYGITMKNVELKGKDFILNADELLRSAENSIVYLSNPNNPTSNMLLIDEDLISKIAKRSRLLVIDEAYYEFSGITFSDLVYEHDNLVILRSLSKAFNLAGARLGYSISNKKTREIFERLKIGYEVPILSQAMALGALQDLDYMKKTVSYITSLRDEIRMKLLKLGIWSPKSSTNFLFLELPMKCIEAKKELEKWEIEVLCLSGVPKFEGFFDNWMRVSIGHNDEMELFMEKIQLILSQFQYEVLSYERKRS